MTIISLNLWGGRRFEKLLPFIREKAKEVDVFCFQEMIDGGPAASVTNLGIRGNLFTELAQALPEFTGFTFLSPVPKRYHGEIAQLGVVYGLAMFVKKDWSVVASGEQRLYNDGLEDIQTTSFGTGDFQWVVIEREGKRFGVGTAHGLFLEYRADDPGKKDTVERIEQSRRLVEFLNQQHGRGVVVGDLNLRPETESIAMLSRVARNLIKEYNITNTRNYEYQLIEQFKDYISDYAFTGPAIIVKDFQVLPDVVSDHAALQLVIE